MNLELDCMAKACAKGVLFAQTPVWLSAAFVQRIFSGTSQRMFTSSVAVPEGWSLLQGAFAGIFQGTRFREFCCATAWQISTTGTEIQCASAGPDLIVRPVRLLRVRVSEDLTQAKLLILKGGDSHVRIIL